MSIHSSMPLNTNHAIYNWEFKNSSYRLAELATKNNIAYKVIFTAEDIGKVAYQTSDKSFWVLTGFDPASWLCLTHDMPIVCADETERNNLVLSVKDYGTHVYQQDTNELYLVVRGEDEFVTVSWLDIPNADRVIFATEQDLLENLGSLVTDTTVYGVASSSNSIFKVVSKVGLQVTWERVLTKFFATEADRLAWVSMIPEEDQTVAYVQATTALHILTVTGRKEVYKASFKLNSGVSSFNAQLASYALQDSDASTVNATKYVTISNGAANTVTVSPNLIGDTFNIIQEGAGQTTLVPGVGVTLKGTPGLKFRAQYSAVTLVKQETNVYYVIGDLSA